MQICCFADSREVLPGRAVQRLLLAPEGRLLPAAQALRVLRDTQAVRVLLLAPAARGCHICSDSQASPEDSDGRNRRDAPVVLEDCTCQDAYVSQVVLPDSVGAMIYIDQDNP